MPRPTHLKQNLFIQLYEQGLKMIHGLKKNMNNKLIDLNEKILLRKRNLIETVFDYLKNKMNLEHTRHRSFINAFVHIVSTLVAFSLKKHKPSMRFDYSFSVPSPLIPNSYNKKCQDKYNLINYIFGRMGKLYPELKLRLHTLAKTHPFG